MTPHLPNPFKPSKLNAISMLVSKVTTLLNHSLTVRQVKQLHALVLVNGLNHLEPVVITQLISIQSSHSQATSRYIQSLIHHSKYPNVVPRTSAIQFFYHCGEFQEALVEYVHMQRSGLLPTTSAVASALKACTRLGNRICGVTIHAQAHGYGFCGDVHVGTALVGFYSNLDDADTAKRVCNEMSERNAASCVIERYLESGNLTMAEHLFSEMGNKDIASWNSMVSWYARTGDMEKAIASFGPMPVKNPASWTAMISGYVDCEEMEIARNFYDVMPNQDISSSIKMIGGYSTCGAVEAAREIFDEMVKKNCSLYTAMITCYAQNGRPNDALQLFDEMLRPNVSIQPDNTTLATVISICSQLGDLSSGSWIEETLMKQMGIAMDDHLGIALIDLYAKCGRFDKAYELFHGLQKKDVAAYTSLILACGRNGWKRDAIKLFEEMLQANICPNSVTFSGLLTAIDHVGMVEKSYHGFNSANPLPPPRPSNHEGNLEESYRGFNPGPLPSNHLGRAEESYHGVNFTNPPPPLNHSGGVQESYRGVTSASPVALPRQPNPSGMVEETYHGVNTGRPWNHICGFAGSYRGVNFTSPLSPGRPLNQDQLSYHEGRIEESYHGVNTGNPSPPMEATYTGRVEESYHGINSPRPSNHGVKGSYGRVNSTSQLPPPRQLNHTRMAEGSYHRGFNPTSPRPLKHMGMAEEGCHGFNPTSPRPLKHMGMAEEGCHGFNPTSPIPTPMPSNHVEMVEESDDGFHATSKLPPPRSFG